MSIWTRPFTTTQFDASIKAAGSRMVFGLIRVLVTAVMVPVVVVSITMVVLLASYFLHPSHKSGDGIAMGFIIFEGTPIIYIQSIIPCAVYASIMEIAQVRGIKPGTWTAFLFSITIAIILAVILVGAKSNWRMSALCGGAIIGVLVGAIVAPLSFLLYPQKKTPNHSPEPTPGAVH